MFDAARPGGSDFGGVGTSGRAAAPEATAVRVSAQEAGSQAMKRPVLLIAAALALCPAAPVLAEDVTRSDRFKLWNNCRAMDLAVEGLPQDAADIALTRGAIETAVRSRLRAARLYDADVAAFLYVNVNVLGRAFSIRVEYNKPLFDPASDQFFSATTWNSGSTGTHGGNGSYILSSVSRHMDKFIDEYLRVNADACPR